MRGFDGGGLLRLTLGLAFLAGLLYWASEEGVDPPASAEVGPSIERSRHVERVHEGSTKPHPEPASQRSAHSVLGQKGAGVAPGAGGAVEVLVRVVGRGEGGGVRSPMCARSTPGDSLLSKRPDAQSIRMAATGNENGELRIQLEGDGAWFWFGAEGYAWKKVYLERGEGEPVVALQKSGAIAVSLERDTPAAADSDCAVAVMSDRGAVIFEQEIDLDGNQLLIGGVLPGRYYVVCRVARQSDGAESEARGEVDVKVGRTSLCSLVISAKPGGEGVLSGFIAGFAEKSLYSPKSISLQAIAQYPSSPQGRGQGRFEAYDIPTSITDDGAVCYFGPVRLPEGMYSLHLDEPAQSWEVLVAGESHVSLRASALSATYLDFVEAGSGEPVGGVSASWSIYPRGAVGQQDVRLARTIKLGRRESSIKLVCMEGVLAMRVYAQGYVPTLVVELADNDGHLIVPLHRAPDILIRPIGQDGRTAHVGSEWVSGLSLVDESGSLTRPALVGYQRVYKPVRLGPADSASSERLGDISEVRITAPSPGRYRVITASNGESGRGLSEWVVCHAGETTTVDFVVE